MSPKRFVIAVLALSLATLADRKTATAQPVSELPRAEYYLAREMLGSGATLPALEGFEAAFNRARRVGQNRWIDSIPPLVMAGECYYRQGNLVAAMEQYDQALMLALANPGWVDSLDFAVDQLPQQEFNRGVNWFNRPTNSSLLSVPESVQLAVDPLQAQVGSQGGVIAPVSLVTRLDIAEVLYTTGLALRRRLELLGPLAQHSPLADPLEGYFAGRPQQQAAWLQGAWATLQGLSKLSKPGLAPDAVRDLRAGVLVLDRHHHYLSSLALQALADGDLRDGRFQSAAENLQVANLLAAQFEQHIAFEETSRQLASIATALRRDDIADGLAGLSSWAVKRSPTTACAAQLGLASYFAHLGKLPQAEKAIAQCLPLLRNRDVMLPKQDARLKHTQSLVAFLSGKTTPGERLLSESLAAMQGDARTGAYVPEVFQAQMTLDLLAKGNISDQVAEELLDGIMQEPTASQWQLRPLESLARITTSSMPAYERLLDLAMLRGAANDELFHRMDRLQRQRFYEALPLGGRLATLRFSVNQLLPGNPPGGAKIGVLPDPLNDQAMKRLMDVQSGIAISHAQLRTSAEQLRAAKLVLDDRKASSAAKKQFASFATAADQLERELTAASLKSIPLNRHLPGEASLATVQQAMQPGELFLSFAMTSSGVYGIGIRNDAVHVWQMPSKSDVVEKLATFMAGTGLWKTQGRLLPSVVTKQDPAWRDAALALRNSIFSGQIQEWLANSNQLVIAPHGALWYIPFEVLPVGVDATSNPTIADMHVSYLPMLSAYKPIDAQVPNVGSVVGISGRFFAPGEEANRTLAAPLVNFWPGKQNLALDQKNNAPSTAWIRLRTDLIWSATMLNSSGMDTTVIPLGPGRQQPLRKWFEMAGYVPKIVVLPGLRTSLGNGNLGDGADLFLPVCSLHYSGVRSAMISRWAVGGQSTADLLLRYFEELGREPPPEALRRATVNLWGSQFLIQSEPALMPAGNEAQALTSGFHPVLWAGYMSIGR